MFCFHRGWYVFTFNLNHHHRTNILHSKFCNLQYKPPMAMVNVTPIILDSAVAVPKQPIPVPIVFELKNIPMAATLPKSIPRFIACRPGNSNGAESSKPSKGKIMS